MVTMYTKFADKIFESSYAWRTKYLQSLWRLLTRIGLTANDITFFRLVFIIPLYLLSVIWPNLFWFAIVYILFWLFDLLDGGLARYQKTASDRGKFLDVFVDVFVYSVTLLLLLFFSLGNSLIFAYQILIHASVYILAIVSKYEGAKTDWIILPKPDLTYLKFTAHAILLIAVLFNLEIINIGFMILNAYMSVLALYYFYKIYRKKIWKI